ncbi:MAG: amidohydrolase [Bacteroidota bacterium]
MKKGLILIIIIVLLPGCKKETYSDMIIKNAKIYSVNDDFDIYESMVIDEGKIIALGTNEEIENKYESGNILDFGGKAVYPGFIDPHCHFYGYGLSLSEANLFGTTSFEEVLERLSEHAEKYPEGWITGMGWDQNDWEIKKFPDNHLLDSLFPNRPVLIRRIDGHAAIANTVALEIAAIDPKTSIEGGDIIKENGKLTGVLIDNAIDMVRNNIPQPGKDEISRALLSAQENCFAVGLTSVHDAGLETDIIKIIDELQSSGEVKMRIYAMLNPTEENFENYMYNGIYKTDRLNVRSVKLYADGALGSRGALLVEPYSDDPGNKGLLIASEKYLERISRLADSCGYQVNTHCIGDGANRILLNIYGDILVNKNDKRWRIEHAQIIHPDDFDLFGKYSVIPSIQTTHATSDMYWADERLGDRIKYAYAYQTLLKENGWLPNGSDFPVEDINPLYGFYAGVVRKDQKGYPEGGFQPGEALKRKQALRAMTIWAAKAAFEEKEKGSLEPGKLADFVILDKDIMEAEESELYKVNVLETWMDGERVYHR